MSFAQNGKPRVLLLHPMGFSERDMQWYAPLTERYDILAVTPRWRPQDRAYPKVPQAPLVSVDQVIGAVPVAQRFLDRVLRLHSENLYYFFGLEPLFAAADIVECLETFHPYCLQAVRAKQRFGYGLVFSVHENIAFAHENLEIRRRIKRAAFAHGDAFTPISRQGANALILEGAPAERVHLAGAAIDTSRYTPAAPDPALLVPMGLSVGRAEPDELRLFWAGRFVWEKGAADILQAIALLKREPSGPAYRVVMAGDGPERGRCVQLAARLGIADRVSFVGRVSSDQMIALYRWADIYLAPSVPTPKWQEQFGCVLIEAMGCGCPVIAADSGAISEVVGDAAVLVAPNQPTRWAEAIAELGADSALRETLGAAGRERVVTHFDIGVLSDRIAAVYDRILHDRSAARAV